MVFGVSKEDSTSKEIAMTIIAQHSLKKRKPTKEEEIYAMWLDKVLHELPPCTVIIEFADWY